MGVPPMCSRGAVVAPYNPRMWERFPPRMKKTITAALELAGQAGCDEAAAEHLLAAIARDEACAGNFMLEQAGIAPSAVLERMGGGAGEFPPAEAGGPVE